MASGNNPRVPLLICVLLTLAILAIYWPVSSFDFVNYDDPIYAAGNPHVQSGITAGSLAWGFKNIEAEFWQPLTWWSHMLDCQLYGTRAGGHHVTNLLLHIANTLVLFFALNLLTSMPWRSGFVAALFALHPLHVESVAWISERKDVLSTFFGLLTLLAYAAYRQTRSPELVLKEAQAGAASGVEKRRFLYYGLGLLCFVLSLMSKPTFVTLPFLLLLLDYWPLNRLSLADFGSFLKTGTAPLVEKIPFFAVTATGALSAYWIQASRHNLGGLEQYPMSLRFGNAVMSYFRYVRKMFWPIDLAVFYPYPDECPAAYVAGAGALLAIITLLAILYAKRLPYFPVGWFWYLGTLVPMIGLVQVAHHAMADRYTYVPLIGCFIVLVWGIADLALKIKVTERALALAGALCLLAIAWVGARQVAYWRNSESLFVHAIAVTENNYVAHDNLGAALDQQGRFDDALAQFQEAFRIERARKVNPDLSSIRFDLGTALFRKDRYEEAKTHLRRALEIQPNLARVHHNLACVLALQGNLDEAISEYQAALQIDPQYQEARACLNAIMAQRQQAQMAMAHYNSGLEFLKQQRAAEGLKEYREALKLRPDWPEVMNAIASQLATNPNSEARNGLEAVSLAEGACRLTSSTNLEMMATLAAAYAEAGRFDDASSLQERVCKLAATQGQTNCAAQGAQRLESYRSKQAYHQP